MTSKTVWGMGLGGALALMATLPAMAQEAATAAAEAAPAVAEAVSTVDKEGVNSTV